MGKTGRIIILLKFIIFCIVLLQTGELMPGAWHTALAMPWRWRIFRLHGILMNLELNLHGSRLDFAVCLKCYCLISLDLVASGLE